jgi:serine/threonine-protein kinase RsbW
MPFGATSEGRTAYNLVAAGNLVVISGNRIPSMADDNHWTWTHERRLPSVRGASHPVLAELMAALERERWAEHEIFGIHMAVEEALVNAIRHGNGSDSAKQVHFICKLGPQRILIEITDEGPGFCPEAVPDCTAEENLERPSGRGIMLMRNYMTRVEYVDGGCRVVMEKHKSAKP